MNFQCNHRIGTVLQNIVESMDQYWQNANCIGRLENHKITVKYRIMFFIVWCILLCDTFVYIWILVIKMLNDKPKKRRKMRITLTMKLRFSWCAHNFNVKALRVKWFLILNSAEFSLDYCLFIADGTYHNLQVRKEK